MTLIDIKKPTRRIRDRVRLRHVKLEGGFIYGRFDDDDSTVRSFSLSGDSDKYTDDDIENYEPEPLDLPAFLRREPAPEARPDVIAGSAACSPKFYYQHEPLRTPTAPQADPLAELRRQIAMWLAFAEGHLAQHELEAAQARSRISTLKQVIEELDAVANPAGERAQGESDGR